MIGQGIFDNSKTCIDCKCIIGYLQSYQYVDKTKRVHKNLCVNCYDNRRRVEYLIEVRNDRTRHI